MRVLLTGGTGFLGTHLIRQLIRRGATSITVIGRRPVEAPGVFNLLVRELSVPEIAHELGSRKFDCLIHLAAAGVHPGDRDWLQLVAINALLPSQLVQLSATLGVRAVLIAGSSAEYRASADTLRIAESAPLESTKLYGATKAAGGLLALATAAQLQLPIAVLRLFNLYGPGEAAHRLLPSLTSSLASGQAVALSSGEQIRDFVYVSDACKAMIITLERLLEGSAQSAAYNVATGEGHSVADFARCVAQAWGADQDLLNFGAIPMRRDDTPYLVGDPAAIALAVGWQAEWSLRKGIADCIGRPAR